MGLPSHLAGYSGHGRRRNRVGRGRPAAGRRAVVRWLGWTVRRLRPRLRRRHRCCRCSVPPAPPPPGRGRSEPRRRRRPSAAAAAVTQGRRGVSTGQQSEQLTPDHTATIDLSQDRSSPEQLTPDQRHNRTITVDSSADRHCPRMPCRAQTFYFVVVSNYTS